VCQNRVSSYTFVSRSIVWVEMNLPHLAMPQHIVTCLTSVRISKILFLISWLAPKSHLLPKYTRYDHYTDHYLNDGRKITSNWQRVMTPILLTVCKLLVNELICFFCTFFHEIDYLVKFVSVSITNLMISSHSN